MVNFFINVYCLMTPQDCKQLDDHKVTHGDLRHRINLRFEYTMLQVRKGLFGKWFLRGRNEIITIFYYYYDVVITWYTGFKYTLNVYADTGTLKTLL